LDAIADTYVESDAVANINGGDNRITVDGDSDKINRALIQFDVNSIPSSATVEIAMLTLCYENGPSAAAQGRTNSLHRATSGWVELVVTWLLQPSFDPVATDSVVVPAAQVCISFDVTTDVQGWVDGTSNFGWVLKDSLEDTSGNSEARYRSRETSETDEHPHLDITYRP
jgi:hypothetical protein